MKADPSFARDDSEPEDDCSLIDAALLVSYIQGLPRVRREIARTSRCLHPGQKLATTDVRTPPRRRSRDRELLRAVEWQFIDRELGLSGREHDIMELVLADVKESAMGARLGISPHTVHTHLERLYRKLGVSGRVQLVVRALGACLAHVRPGVSTPVVPVIDPNLVALSPEQVTRIRD